jgi:hypothetical protein
MSKFNPFPYSIIKAPQLEFFLETRERYVNLPRGSKTQELMDARQDAARHLKLLKRTA